LNFLIAYPCFQFTADFLKKKLKKKIMVFSTLRRFIKFPATALCLAGPIEAVIDQDVVNYDSKTAKSFQKYVDTETGWDRIKKMFELE
jgi:hypothetical protein